MREAHPRELPTGVRYYVSDTDGTGGRLKDRVEDFRVRELEAVDVEPVDADPGSYSHLVFRATLRGWDTNDFADALSTKLGISRERVSWAGTKDKHAVTTQLFSLQGGDPPLPNLDRAQVEVLGRTGRPVLFGDLDGNAFEIVVRDAGHPENASAIGEELRAFACGAPANGEATGDDARVGVPNFFGPQRFGSYRPVTATVGFRILDRDWAGAVREYICARSDAEPAATRDARAEVDEHWRAREWADLVNHLPRRLQYERSLLHGLAESGGDEPADYKESLERLPSNLQSMFVHAAQSKLFNEVLSRRLEHELPFHEPVTGDVVCFASDDPRRTSPGSREREPQPTEAAIDRPDNERIQHVDADRVGTVTRHCARGRAFLTAPLVGTDTAFGDGEPAEIVHSVLADHDLAPTDFDLPGAFGSTGTRRAILVRTDVTVERDPLSFNFSLPKGSYATTLLREYLKCDPLDLT